MTQLLLGGMCNAGSLGELEARLDVAQQAGFQRVQVSLRDASLIHEIAKIFNLAAEADLEIVALGCYANPLEPDDPRLHGATVDDAKLLLELLRDIDHRAAMPVVLWSGTVGDDLLHADVRNWKAATWEMLLSTTGELVDSAISSGCQVVMEPYFRHCLATPRDYVLFSRELNARRSSHTGQLPFGVVLDAPNFLDAWSLKDVDDHLAAIITDLASITQLVHLKDIAPQISTQGAAVTETEPGANPALPEAGGGIIDYPLYIRNLRDKLGKPTVAIAEHYDELDVLTATRVRRLLLDAGVSE